MKNNFYYLFLAKIIWLVSLCNCYANQESIQNILNKKNQITQQKAQSTDTIQFKLTNKPTVIPTPSDTKIIIAKDESATDWAKYLIPTFTLLLGIGINRLIDWLNTKKRIIKTGERWIVEIRNIEEPIKSQIESLVIFKDKLTAQDFIPPTLTIMTSINGEVYKSLDKNELFKYIDLKNNSLIRLKRAHKSEKEAGYKKVIVISNRTHGYVSILEHLYNNIVEKYNAYLQGTSQHTTSFTKNLQTFLSELRQFNLSFELAGENITTNPVTSPLLQLFMEYIQPHMQDGKYNPFILRDNFFMPILQHLITHRLEPRTIPLASAATACLNDIAGIQMERTYMIENIDILIKRYTELLVDLPLLVDEILGKKEQKTESAK